MQTIDVVQNLIHLRNSIHGRVVPDLRPREPHFISCPPARIPYSDTHLIEQIGPVERMDKLDKATRIHTEDAGNIVLYSIAQ